VIFATIRDHLAREGLLLREGTIVDATLIAAPPSTKNRDRARDPDMHQARKGQQWHFGMKAHIGVDLDSGLVHTVLTTPAHVNDVTQAHGLLQGQETVVLGDAGYQGVDRRPENQARPVTWHVALRPGVRRALPNDELGRLRQRIERVKASLRAKVEHPFHVVKNLFRYRKTRYRGLAKNTAQVVTLFGLANLVLAGWRLRARDTLRAS
jgi:IS5 family transposase